MGPILESGTTVLVSQGASQGGGEVFVAVLLLNMFLALMVYGDAKRNAKSPLAWALGTFLFVIPVFPLYLLLVYSGSTADHGGGSNRGRGVVCLECNQVNDWDNDFCNRCGAALRLVCPGCGSHELVEHDACPSCGADMRGATAPGEGGSTGDDWGAGSRGSSADF